ncbi:hypothetical protein D9M68_628840 [compost metagenome]
MAKSKSILITLLLFVCSLSYAQQSDKLRQEIQRTYTNQIGVRELTGRNDGKEVETYLSYVWLKKGQPWCAAFVSWSFGQNGVRSARSGGCVQLMEQGRTIYRAGKAIENPKKADVFFIYFAEKGRVAHTGFIDKWSDEWVDAVEGNTNQAGSREGDGVYRKKRLKRQIYAVTTFIN